MSSADRDSGSASSSPATPQGGQGAAGIQCALTVEEFTGTASLSVPLAGSAPRGLAPDLALHYGSLAPNGPAGLGFSLSLPSISLYTGAGVPRYDGSDSYAFGGQPLVELPEAPRQITVGEVTYIVTRYAPSTASIAERIERWVAPDGDTIWRHIEQSGLESIYGLDDSARIADPTEPRRVFTWLLQAQYNQSGEAISYEYLAENSANLPEQPWEAGRDRSAQRYLGSVRYAPHTPVTPPPYGIGPMPDVQWHVEVLFDYGQYDANPSNPSPYEPTGEWLSRPDPFSRYDAGFEVRTHRLLRNIMLFHRFAELGPNPALVHLTRLTYDESPIASRLVRYDSIGCAEGQYAPLPPLELQYTPLSLGELPFDPVGASGPERLVGIVNPPDYTLSDLTGRGVGSVLYADGESVRSYPAQGGRGAKYGRGETLASFPVQRTAASETAKLFDVTSGGIPDLLVTTPAQAGMYAGGEGGFQPFQAFENAATELADPAATFADLSNDGLADIVTMANGRLRRYPGEGASGFGTATEIPLPEDMPVTLDGERQALIGFADILGGGAQDLVRIANGVVECWPSLGYGVFGERVKLGGAPYLGEEFDAQRVMLADLDGSGLQDIVYVTPDRALVYMNQSGNSFASPVEIPLPVTVGSPSQVAIADLRGTGTDMIIVSSDVPEPQHWACAPAGEARPYLLSALRNGMGADTQISYSTSTRYRLEDEAAGVPWLTTLPFPVTVVAEVVQHDLVSGCSETATYSYRHGYWCTEDLAYGFAMVQRCDAEAIEGQSAVSAAPRRTLTWRSLGTLDDPTLDAAIRAEWFGGDPHAQTLSGPVIAWDGPVPSDGETVRQAYASLRGRAVREEIYGLDNGPNEETPYRVTQTVSEACFVAPAGDGPYAAFATHEREMLEYLYEREASDPAVRQTCNLQIDEYGQVTQSVVVAYPRRHRAEQEQPWTAQQQETLVVCNGFTYIDINQESVFRVGIPCTHSCAALTGVPSAPEYGCYSFQQLAKLVKQALAGEGGLGATPNERNRYLYYEQDGTTPAPLGSSGSQALLRTELRAAFSDAQIRTLFAGVLEGQALTALLEQGHYVYDEESGMWWALGNIATYLPAGHFYRTASTVEPCGAVTQYTYDATDVALIETVQSAEGLLTRDVTVLAYDYLALASLAVRDINDTVTEVTLDPLAQVVYSSYHGTEMDEPAGFEEILEKPRPAPPSAQALISDPSTYLQEAAQAFYYDLLSWSGQVTTAELETLGLDSKALLAALAAAGYTTPEGVVLRAFRELRDASEMVLSQPFAAHAEAIYALIADLPSEVPVHWVLSSARNYPGVEGGASESEAGMPEVAVDYVDGFGRTVQRKQQRSGAEKEGWATSGAVRYNSRGLVYARCEPFFSDSWQFTPEALSEDLGAATLVTYDPLDRQIKLEKPEGFFSATQIAAWSLTQSDEIDTVLQSRYHREHGEGQGIGPHELQALRQSEALAETPTTYQLDPLGNAIAQVDLLKGAAGEQQGAVQTLITRYGRDVLGRQIWSADPRLVAAGEEAKSFQTVYSYTGEVLYAISADAGERLRLPNASGQDLFMRDGRGIDIATSYDTLGRPVAVTLNEQQVVEAYVYADQLVEGVPVVPDPQGRNMMGEVYRLFDLAGMREVDGYSLGGEPTAMTQRYLAEPAAQPDWTPAHATPSSPLLSKEEWSSTRTFDAGGRCTAMTDAVGSVYRWTYDLLGFVAAIGMSLPGGKSVAYLQSVEYNALGQRTRVVYGNGVVARYDYYPLNFRLKAAIVTRGESGQAIQEPSYVYDPIGNLTFSEDPAFNALFGDAVPSLQRSFVYDSLYRMVTAVGLEMSGYTAAQERAAGYETVTVATNAEGKLPAGSLVTATRTQAYDTASNLYWTERAAGGSAWTTETVLSATSNRGVSTSLLGLDPAPAGVVPPERTLSQAQIDAFFDGDGNQTVVEQMPVVSWDYADRIYAAQVDMPEGGKGSLLRSHDALNQLMRECQQTPANGGTKTVDALYLDTLEVAKATSPESGESTGWRIQVMDGVRQIAEARVQGSETSIAYSLTEPSGSVAVRLDPEGKLLSYEVYTPYGATAFAVLPDEAEAKDKLVRYDGRMRDRLSGTYVFERRDLAPWLGRWLSPDPTGPVDGLNLFLFVCANPSSNIDIGGRVTLKFTDSDAVIEVSAKQIREAVEKAALEVQKDAASDPLTSTKEDRGMPRYEATKRGDLMRLSYDTKLRGDSLTKGAVANYVLTFGVFDVTEKKLPFEPGVHGTQIVKAGIGDGGLVGYDHLVKGANTGKEKEEAGRLIHMFKVKATPQASDANASIIPVMAISEADRSVAGGMLAMIELYNVKYGVRKFSEAFTNKNDPFFIGAKKEGGAKALKDLDRVRRGLIAETKEVKDELKRLDESLETFVEALHSGRGKGKVSKFAGMTTAKQVTDEITRILRKRMRVTQASTSVVAQASTSVVNQDSSGGSQAPTTVVTQAPVSNSVLGKRRARSPAEGEPPIKKMVLRSKK